MTYLIDLMQLKMNCSLLLCLIIILLIINYNLGIEQDNEQMNQTLEIYSQQCSHHQNIFQIAPSYEHRFYASKFNISKTIESLLSLEETQDNNIFNIFWNQIWDSIKIIIIWLCVLVIWLMFILLKMCKKYKKCDQSEMCKKCDQCEMCKKCLNCLKRLISSTLIKILIRVVICCSLIICVYFNLQGITDMEIIPCQVLKFINIFGEGGTKIEQKEWKWKGLEGLQNSLYIAEQSLIKYIDISYNQFSRVNFTKSNLLYYDLILSNQQRDQDIQYQTIKQINSELNQASYFQQNSLLTNMKIGEYNSELEILKRIEPQNKIIHNHYEGLLNYINQTNKLGDILYMKKEETIQLLRQIQDKLNYDKTYINNYGNHFYYKLISTIESAQITELIILTPNYAFLILISISSIIYQCIKCCKCCKCGGCYINIFKLLFVLSYVFVGASICFWITIIQEGCLQSKLMITNKEAYMSSKLFDGQMKPLFQECLFEKGSIDDYYNITDLLQMFDNFQLIINKLKNKIEESPKSYLKGMKLLKNNQLILQDMITLRLIDFEDDKTEDPSNIKYKLKQGFLNCTGDQFVEFKESCLPNLEFYDSLLNSTYPKIEGPLCMQTSIFTSIHFKRINKRLQNCSEYELVQTFLKEQIYNWKMIYEHESQIIQKFENLNEEINHQISLIIKYYSLIENILIPFQKIKDCINCQFMQTHLQEVMNPFCINTYNLFYIQELIMLALILFLILICLCKSIRTKSSNYLHVQSTISSQNNLVPNVQMGELEINSRQSCLQ